MDNPIRDDAPQFPGLPRGSAPEDASVADRILRALKGLRYGSVEIVVHDARVVQIERKEKFRLDGRS